MAAMDGYFGSSDVVTNGRKSGGVRAMPERLRDEDRTMFRGAALRLASLAESAKETFDLHGPIRNAEWKRKWDRYTRLNVAVKVLTEIANE